MFINLYKALPYKKNPADSLKRHAFCKKKTQKSCPFKLRADFGVSRINMNTISGRIGDDYGWEITVFHKLREASDGVIFIDGKINWDRYLADHSPRFEIHLVMFNYTIIEINIYYLHHRDGDE